MDYQSQITLKIKSRIELTWGIENLRFCNGLTFSQLNSQMIIEADASFQGRKQSANGVPTPGQ